MLTFREDALIRRRDKDLGDSVESQQHQRFEGCQSIAEVDQGRDEDEKVQHERADVAERHCGGRKSSLRKRIVSVCVEACYLGLGPILGWPATVSSVYVWRALEVELIA